MSRSRVIGASLPPATERVRTLDKGVHLIPAWLRPEVARETREDRALGLYRNCTPSIAAQAARDAALWLQAIGAVIPR